jgi:hypothetical protein
MNAPRAEANKSIAEVEKTAVSLSGILKGFSAVDHVKSDRLLMLTSQIVFMFNAICTVFEFQRTYDTYLENRLR